MLISFASQKLKWQHSDYLCSAPVQWLLDSIKFLVSEREMISSCFALQWLSSLVSLTKTWPLKRAIKWTLLPRNNSITRGVLLNFKSEIFLKLSHSENIIDPSSHVEFSKSKILYYVEDYTSSIDIHTYQVWYKLFQCFVRNRLKCLKFTDNRQWWLTQMMTISHIAQSVPKTCSQTNE